MTLERFRLAAALPPEGPWRLELVLDVSVAPPRPVVLARVPAAVTGDALALTALMREVERASRATHPMLLPVRGLADAGGLSVLCEWREGEPLSALLAAGGPPPAPVALRVLLNVGAALEAAHLAGAVHGDLRPERVLVTEDGAVLLTGLGRSAPPGATAGDDVAALAGLVTACLGSDPEGEWEAVARSAAAQDSLREWVLALRRCPVPPAPPAEMAAWLETLLPADGAARSARRLALTLARRAGGNATPPPAARAPEVAGDRPAHTPPPLPGGMRAADLEDLPSPNPSPSPSPSPSPGPGPSLASTAIPIPASIPTSPPTAPPPTWLDHPAAPLSAGVAMALLGLALGFWLGR